jgi:hypothetical protein
MHQLLEEDELINRPNAADEDWQAVPWLYPRIMYRADIFTTARSQDQIFRQAYNNINRPPLITFTPSRRRRGHNQNLRRYRNRVCCATIYERFMVQYTTSEHTVIDSSPLPIAGPQHNRTERDPVALFDQLGRLATTLHITIILEVEGTSALQEFQRGNWDCCAGLAMPFWWTEYIKNIALMNEKLRHLCINFIIRAPKLRGTHKIWLLAVIIRAKFGLMYQSWPEDKRD